jgi:hypothetical protein
MKSFGQFCPVAKAAELFCGRWTPLIVRAWRRAPRGSPSCSAVCR